MGWITANGENISIHKEIEWLTRYVAHLHESANLSRRAHSAMLQYVTAGNVLLVLWAVWAATSSEPIWQKGIAFVLVCVFASWSYKAVSKANEALRRHEESRPELPNSAAFMPGQLADGDPGDH